MKTASFHTLGCRLNQTESALLAHQLKAQGYRVVEEKGGADLCVINSCTVTGQTDQKVRQLVRNIQKNNPGAVIAVLGCFSQMSSEELLEIGGVDLILGTQEKMKLVEYLGRLEPGEGPLVAVGPISKEEFTILQADQHLALTRANLKIQEGCDFLCSFCIIPQARGRSRSRRFGDALSEAEALGQAGVKELVLTGVNLGCFATEGQDFGALLAALEEVPGIERLRISSIEPTTLGPEVFGPMKDPNRKLTPHLHLPLQAGSDVILKAMRRRYSAAEYRAFVLDAAAAVPGLGLGTDVMVGFPGETDADFQATYRLLEELPIQYFHVFPFAERPGTRAASLGERVTPSVATERALALRELSDAKRAAFAQAQVGQLVSVLFERNEGGNRYAGYTGNYLRVLAESEQDLGNQIITVQITATQGALAIGQLI
ncbi:MAG: tRNA (N(6)-L-threonylcarbamoyladenosine(37)-C(2))-methylthiotransferase MtaB [bacterium]|nr:tRNA (N(6)-L-threonylcarbamoyladenosine(37)-C(2))-methylthiotransferase MtaB [bacterium]